MKIAVIGPGAMGLLYGAKLSENANVVLIGNNEKHIDEINANGVTVKRAGNEKKYNVKAFLNGKYNEIVDVVILFTKAYLTESAIAENPEIIGEKTVLLTLQNGAGHDKVLEKFTDKSHILIGTTQQGSYRENFHTIVNSGLGETAIGSVDKNFENKNLICDLFEKSGFPCVFSDDIYKMIWNKLMINASSSVLSGVLQVNQGFIAENEFAWELCKKLIYEICEAAGSCGYHFDVLQQTERIYKHLKNAPGGYTSIYSDIKNGRKTEVDFISGAVLNAAKAAGKTALNQEFIVQAVHALEGKAMEVK